MFHGLLSAKSTYYPAGLRTYPEAVFLSSGWVNLQDVLHTPRHPPMLDDSISAASLGQDPSLRMALILSFAAGASKVPSTE
jgi:hypothetical protein